MGSSSRPTGKQCLFQDISNQVFSANALRCWLCLQGGDLLDWTSDVGIQEDAFIQRIEALSTMGYSVLISNMQRYFECAAYLSTFTRESIVIALGVPSLQVLPCHLPCFHLTSTPCQRDIGQGHPPSRLSSMELTSSARRGVQDFLLACKAPVSSYTNAAMTKTF